MCGAGHRSFQMLLATLSLGSFFTQYITTCDLAAIIRRYIFLHHCVVGRTRCRRNPRLAHAVANLLSPDDLLFGQNTGKKPSDVIVLRDGPLHQIPARPALPVLRQLTLMDAFARAVRARRA